MPLSPEEKAEATLQEYRKLSRRLQGLLDDPQPGLAAWCLIFGDTMESLMDLWNRKDSDAD